MPRFVILEHDHPEPHFDFMLEFGNNLRTWRLSSLPEIGQVLTITAIFDHRLIYLDYEGVVSGNRGNVIRRDWGTFEILREQVGELRIRLHGQRFSAILGLQQLNHSEWAMAVLNEETGTIPPPFR